MASGNAERGSAAPRPISALPSVQARILAFAAILVAGICGGLIGYSAVKVSCQGTHTTFPIPVVTAAGSPATVAGPTPTVAGGTSKKCSTSEGVGGLVGAVIAAIGVAVIAVLVLRAMGEWRTIKEKRQLQQVIAAAAGMPPDEGDAAPEVVPGVDDPS